MDLALNLPGVNFGPASPDARQKLVPVPKNTANDRVAEGEAALRSRNVTALVTNEVRSAMKWTLRAKGKEQDFIAKNSPDLQKIERAIIFEHALEAVSGEDQIKVNVKKIQDDAGGMVKAFLGKPDADMIVCRYVLRNRVEECMKVRLDDSAARRVMAELREVDEVENATEKLMTAIVDKYATAEVSAEIMKNGDIDYATVSYIQNDLKLLLDGLYENGLVHLEEVLSSYVGGNDKQEGK